MKYTEKSAAAVVNSLLTCARRNKVRPELHNPWTDSQGRFCVCDGFRAYRLAKEPKGVTVQWSAATPHKAAGDGYKKLDLSPIFAPLDAGKVVEMPAPDPDAISAFVDRHSIVCKRGRRLVNTVYDLGADLPAVNVKYLQDVMKLFPDAKWYVDADPYARMIRPMYAICENGSAAICPIRVSSKPPKRPEDTAVHTDKSPKERRENIPASKPGADADPGQWLRDHKYFVYSKPAGEKRFLLTDIARGRVGLKLMFAPRYTDNELERLKEMLDEVAAENPGAHFQIRRTDCRTVVYTAEPTYSPESFAALIVA